MRGSILRFKPFCKPPGAAFSDGDGEDAAGEKQEKVRAEKLPEGE